MKLTATSAALALATFLTTTAQAQGFNSDNLYGGAGLTFNSLGFGNSTGFQIFAGYELDVRINGDIDAAIEVGFMDTGDDDGFPDDGVDGLWVNFVNGVQVNNKLKAYTRLGIDFGDDDGIMVGAGMGYDFNDTTAFRVEYVSRDNINGMQFNVLFGM